MKLIPIRVLPPAGPVDTRWRFQRLLSAPHRLGFFAAAVMLAASGLWWSGVLLLQTLGHRTTWAVAPGAAHGLWMGLGFIPLFITGFWCTAGPKWLGLPPVDARSLRVAVFAMLLGWGVAVPGFHLSAVAAATGLALGAAAWTSLCWRFGGQLRRSGMGDKQHATLIVLACCAGALAWWVAAAALFSGQLLLLRSAAWAALWCFAATVFTVASHRMLPFYDAGRPVVPPRAGLWLLCAVLWGEGGLAVAGLWLTPRPLPWAQVVLEAAVGAWLLWLAWRAARRSNQLLAMLHTGFLWLAVSFVLAAVSHAGEAWAGPAASLGLAPLHAMSMGYLGTTLVAMVTRVITGHSGRAVAVDALAWRLHWVLQAAVLLRVAGSVWPVFATPLIMAAALAWVAAMVAWALRHGRWLGQPRLDGRAG